MSENLKVNANSPVLEHKRKHNLLVDAVPQKDSDGNYKIFENIIDSQGHKRFDGGDITINEITGVTQKYGKWVLSGGHLLIVVACELATGNTIADNTEIAKVNIPDWIKEKIVPIKGHTVVVSQVLFFNQEYGFDIETINLRKDENGNVTINNITRDISFAQDRPFRIAFDLSIDYDE